jgi:hypothetical protein
MKTLLYTVSDFKEGAIDCIEMLFQNMSFSDTDTDICVIANKQNPSCKYQVIVDDSFQDYAGFLKYSKKIPKGYDQYIYLDSDILFFGDVLDLFDERNFSLVLEPYTMDWSCGQKRQWFLYPYDQSIAYRERASSLPAVNAGSFAFKDIEFIEFVRKSFLSRSYSNVVQAAILEQSCFNYGLYKMCGFNNGDFFDMSFFSVLHAKEKDFQTHKKLYHFCGFSNTMIDKKTIMQKFLQYKDSL